jgi:hypothetical protein
VQKSVPVKLARLLLDITIGCCFDSHPRIDSVLQNSGFHYGLLENAIATEIHSRIFLPKFDEVAARISSTGAEDILESGSTLFDTNY